MVSISLNLTRVGVWHAQNGRAGMEFAALWFFFFFFFLFFFFRFIFDSTFGLHDSIWEEIIIAWLLAGSLSLWMDLCRRWGWVWWWSSMAWWLAWKTWGAHSTQEGKILHLACAEVATYLMRACQLGYGLGFTCLVWPLDKDTKLWRSFFRGQISGSTR